MDEFDDEDIPHTVRQWRDKYLEVYDATANRLKPRRTPQFKAARRKVIDQTFRWLEGLAASHWGQEG